MQSLEKLAEAFLETYSLEEIIELADMEPVDIVVRLLSDGSLDPELPHEVIGD